MRVASFEAVARILDDASVPFVLTGGLAVAAHGYGRFTADIGLVIRLEKGAIARLFHALGSLGIPAADSRLGRGVRRY